jgi:hypothetical protein
MSRFADIAKSVVPVTWHALSIDDRIGATALSSRETYISELIFGSELNEAAQDALNPLVAEYAGKALAFQVVNMGIDFWMDQSQTATTRQPLEVTTYADRLESLQELKKSLLAELKGLEPIVAPLIPNFFIRESASRPLLSSIDDELLTPNPQDFGAIYAEPEV